MNRSANYDDAFWALVDAACDGTLDDAQGMELNRLLIADLDACRRFMEHLQLRADLRLAHRAARGLAQPDVTSPDSEAPRLHPARDPWYRLPTALSVAAVAVSLLVVLFALTPLRVLFPWSPSVASAPAESTPETTNFVAHLVHLQDARWVDPQNAPLPSASLRPQSSLELAAGQAVLRFADGARVVLTGPAKLTLVDGRSASLKAGRVDVRTQGDVGFLVHTPLAEVQDLGTEFGVRTNPAATAIHVYRGLVRVTSILDKSSREVPGGQAVRIRRADGGPILALELEERSGLAASDDALLAGDLPPLPVRRKLALWLAADVGVDRDVAGGVIRWRDLAAAGGMARSALQHDHAHRPRWIAEGIGGQPAIEFGGPQSRLVAAGLVTSGDLTIVVVASGGPGQLINLSAPPHPVAESTGERIVGRVFLGRPLADGSTMTGIVEASPLAAGGPLMAAYVLDVAGGRAELFIDGQSAATAPLRFDASHRADWSRPRQVSIGNHPSSPSGFQGMISEMLIYNAALTGNELQQIFDYLTSRYTRPTAATQEVTELRN